MKTTTHLRLLPALIAGGVFFGHPAGAAVKLGTGNASLLGGDLTDPKDTAKDKPGINYGEGKPEEEMRPQGGDWLSMKLTPVSPPGSPPHQTHAYQSWQGTPACKLFLNNPEKEKWYIGFKDGGRGGPTKEAPYAVAVQLKAPVFLTHFTITTDRSEPVLPDRDPKVWSIQGSLTGKDDDWTDIYQCEATDRASSPLAEQPRNETTLFTAFTGAQAGLLDAANIAKLRAKLKDKRLEKADFALPARAYNWYRIVIYSCFNPNSMDYQDFNRPPGCALSQLELFGVPSVSAAARSSLPPPSSVKTPVVPAKPLPTTRPSGFKN